MMIFADAQQTRGNITHFIGHYYFGMGTVGGRIPTEEGWMIDNTGGWIIQLAKDYEQTGDMGTCGVTPDGCTTAWSSCVR